MSIPGEGRIAARTTSTTSTSTNRATAAGLLTAGLAIVMGMAAGLPAHGAAMRTTANRAILLDATGRQIKMPRAGQPFPSGQTPTYVAYRMSPRQDPPAGTPLIPVTPSRGGVGPLRLDAAALQSINAGLAASTEIAVSEPRQQFLVQRVTTQSLSDASTQFWRAAVAAGKDDADKLGQAVKSAYDTTKHAVEDANDRIVKLLKNAFITPEAPKPVIIPGMPPSPIKLKAAAQVLDKSQVAAQELPTDAEASSSSAPQAAPVPEPSTWLVFAAAATALGVRRRFRKDG